MVIAIDPPEISEDFYHKNPSVLFLFYSSKNRCPILFFNDDDNQSFKEELDQVGYDAVDIGAVKNPPSDGFWVYSGTTKLSRFSEDFDIVYKGDVRLPTNEEWALIIQNKNPFE